MLLMTDAIIAGSTSASAGDTRIRAFETTEAMGMLASTYKPSSESESESADMARFRADIANLGKVLN